MRAESYLFAVGGQWPSLASQETGNQVIKARQACLPFFFLFSVTIADALASNSPKVLNVCASSVTISGHKTNPGKSGTGHTVRLRFAVTPAAGLAWPASFPTVGPMGRQEKEWESQLLTPMNENQKRRAFPGGN